MFLDGFICPVRVLLFLLALDWSCNGLVYWVLQEIDGSLKYLIGPESVQHVLFFNHFLEKFLKN